MQPLNWLQSRLICREKEVWETSVKCPKFALKNNSGIVLRFILAAKTSIIKQEEVARNQVERLPRRGESNCWECLESNRNYEKPDESELQLKVKDFLAKQT